MGRLKRAVAPTLVSLGLVALVVSVALVLDQSANGYVQRIVLYGLVNIVLALSLNLVCGVTGQFSLGHAGFMAIGAYTAASLSLLPWAGEVRAVLGGAELLLFFALSLTGGAVAGLFGLLVGIPSLRLRGDYLAIVTLGFGEITRIVLLNTPSLGGALGLFQLPVPGALSIGAVSLSEFAVLFLYLAFWAILTFVILWRWIYSTHGLVLMSVREDELAAEAMGVRTTQTKVLSFFVSSFFAGVGGSLLALAVGGLNPSNAAFARSVDYIIMVVLGGLGSLTGSVIGALFVTFLPEFVLRYIQDLTGIDLRMVVYSLILILVMILRPQGLMGRRELSWPWYWPKPNGKSSGSISQ
jgi:branched-chain amino acid transport system permease protein